MQKQLKKAFTLVELIVVITILAILGTIAFVSLQGYSKSARDSRRVADISNIKKTLELFSVKIGRYPDPTEAQPVTFSGGLAWYQGTFGNSTFTNVERMKELPLDPLTEIEYTYSLLNTNKEYELSGMFETDNSISTLSPTYAGDAIGTAFVQGTYNGLALRINTSSTSYILAMPSIITSIDLGVEDNRKLKEIIQTKQMVLKNQKNLPSNYINSNYSSQEETTNNNFEIVKDNDIENAIIYEGNIDELTASILVKKLQEAYIGTTVESNQEINAFINLDTQDIDESENVDNFGVNFINNNLGGSAITRIYNTCDSFAHNTTKSYYSSTEVTFSEGSCDSIKKEFTCKDGTWKDGDEDADLSTYQYTSCSVDGARSCTVLETELTHGDELTVYSVDNIVWDDDGNECVNNVGTITCNDGTPEGDTGFAYKTCAKGTPTNCIADSSYDEDGHTYDVIQLDHSVSSQPTLDVSENNGTYTYTLDVICNDGELSSTESGPVLQSCDVNYTQVGEECISYCANGEFDGYNYSDIEHTQTQDVSKDTSPLNGTQETTATLTCSGGTISKSNEVAGSITCDTGYYSNGTSCELQWSGDASTGYLFKNTSGVEQYPTSCSDLLNQTTWKNTLTGSPWNGSKFNDGVYYVKPDSNSAFEVYCDMTTDEGGWTLLSYVKDTNSTGLYENGTICSDIGENCKGDLKKLGASSSNTNGLNELMIKHSNDKRVQMEMNINTPIYKSLVNNEVFSGDFYNTYIIYDNLYNKGGNINKLSLHYKNTDTKSHWLGNRNVNIDNRSTYSTHRDPNDTDDGTMDSVGYTNGHLVWNRYSHGFYIREKLTLTTWVGDGTESNPWKKIGNIVTSCNDIRTSISTNPIGNTWSSSSGTGQDGIYNIDPENDGSGIDVYCDMTTDGGGRTLVGENYDGGMNVSTSVGTVSTDPAGFDEWKLSDTLINEIKSSTSSSVNGFRINYDDHPNIYYWAAACVFDASTTPSSEHCLDWSVNYNQVATYDGGSYSGWYGLCRRIGSHGNNGWSKVSDNYIYYCYNLAFTNGECSKRYSGATNSSLPNPGTNLRVK